MSVIEQRGSPTHHGLLVSPEINYRPFVLLFVQRAPYGDTPVSTRVRSPDRPSDASIISSTPSGTHLCGRLADTAALPPALRTCRSMVALSFVFVRAG